MPLVKFVGQLKTKHFTIITDISLGVTWTSFNANITSKMSWVFLGCWTRDLAVWSHRACLKTSSLGILASWNTSFLRLKKALLASCLDQVWPKHYRHGLRTPVMVKMEKVFVSMTRNNSVSIQVGAWNCKWRWHLAVLRPTKNLWWNGFKFITVHPFVWQERPIRWMLECTYII